MAEANQATKADADDSQGGITSSYASGDGVKLKVPYSFFGSIYGPEGADLIAQAEKEEREAAARSNTEKTQKEGQITPASEETE